MRRSARWPLVVLLCAALVALPIAGSVRAASASAAHGTQNQVDTTGGVVLAMGCGFSAGLFALTFMPLMLVLAVSSCSLMVIDALKTPDR